MKLRTLYLLVTLLVINHMSAQNNQELCVSMNDEMRAIGTIIKDIWANAGYKPANPTFATLINNNDDMIPCDIFLGALQETKTLLKDALPFDQDGQINSIHTVITQLNDQILEQITQIQNTEQPQIAQPVQDSEKTEIGISAPSEDQCSEDQCSEDQDTEGEESECEGSEGEESEDNFTFTMNTSQTPQVVRGTVQADTDFVAGTGFSVIQSSIGVYDIIFDSCFSDVNYQVFVTPSVGLNRRVNVTNTSPQIATVSIYNDGGTPTAQQFNFFVIGN